MEQFSDDRSTYMVSSNLDNSVVHDEWFGDDDDEYDKLPETPVS